MATYYSQVPLYPLSIFCFLILETKALTFNLTNIGPQYQNVNITTFQDAYIDVQGIQVTTDDRDSTLTQKSGKATYIDPLQIWDNSTGNLIDFNTHFTFVIHSEGQPVFADGIAFFLTPNGSNSTAGGAMGLPINASSIVHTAPFVAVEFDTYYDNGWDPIISPVTHVGINVNSLRSNVTAVWYCNITHGIENEAWIRYDSSSKNLSVVFTGSTNTTRVEDTIHLIVDLRDYLPEWVTFGFSAATGALFEKNNVKSWEFSSSLQSNETPMKLEHKKLTPGIAIGLVVSSGVLVASGRRAIFHEGEEDETRSLVEWVWDLYGREKLLEAADLSLGEDFYKHELERLLVLGLWCAHPNSKLRPSIREAIQVLNFEAPSPCLPSAMPVAMYVTPNFMAKSSLFPLSYDNPHSFRREPNAIFEL
ncbi:hypothetical protein Vadar_004330 [Vaccinium darrowii]|uniref:Uncharacterized protein n=1 Tax=Vaccinium darrowii TaxID=229202 RepID=A0ACB7WXT9_9ERIC|nr:hypothetical protein Vadar_004330 [Vaccinium darrowii]